MLMPRSTELRLHVRSVFRRMCHSLLDRLAIRCFKEHSSFRLLVARPLPAGVRCMSRQFFAPTT
jgi:hypothetical protein